MVIKIAKKLGFDGFRSLRAALAEYNRLPLAEIHEELCSCPTPRALAEKVCRASVKAIEDTFSSLSFQDLGRAAQCFCAARQRDLYGVGGSAQVARDAACKFLRIGIRASAFDDSSMMLMSASLLQKGDVVVALSSSGQTLVVVEAARQARRNGARVIAVTNGPLSTLAQEADVLLCTTATGAPLTGENVAARAAQQNLLDALFVAVAQKNPAIAEKNLGRTMSVLRAQRVSW
jgi:DNA-binding MurR/RpiR family transcriptional regulator